MQKIKYIISIFFISTLLLSDDIMRDCPNNFILNPQYPVNGPECYPNDFLFYSSTKQAFYYFDTVTIDESAINSEDWIGAFNGDVCIGARKWDTSQCNNFICDFVP